MSNDENHVKLPGRILIFLFGLMFVIWGFYDINRIQKLGKNGIEADAIVESCVLQKNSDSQDDYRCMLVFGTHKVRFTSKNALETGRIVNIIYDGRNAKNYILGNKKMSLQNLIQDNEPGVYFCMVFGILIFLYGIFIPSEPGGKWTPFWNTLENELYFDGNKYWNILNMILGLPLIMVLALILLPASSGLLKYFSAKSTFLVLNKGTIYLYSMLGLVVLLPFVFMLVNCIEYLIPPAREAFEFDAKHKRGKGFGRANSGLFKFFTHFGMFLLPVVMWSFFQYYSFDGKGIHDHRFPIPAKDYSWDDVFMINLKAQDDESVQCSFILKGGGEIEIKKGYFTTIKNDRDILLAYVKILEHIPDTQKVKQNINITPGVKQIVDEITGTNH